MNTSGLLQSYREALRASFTLQSSRSIHDSMNIPKIEFISLMHYLVVFSGCGDSSARCFAGKSGSLKREFRGHQGAINALQVNYNISTV